MRGDACDVIRVHACHDDPCDPRHDVPWNCDPFCHDDSRDDPNDDDCLFYGHLPSSRDVRERHRVCCDVHLCDSHRKICAPCDTRPCEIYYDNLWSCDLFCGPFFRRIFHPCDPSRLRDARRISPPRRDASSCDRRVPRDVSSDAPYRALRDRPYRDDDGSCALCRPSRRDPRDDRNDACDRRLTPSDDLCDDVYDRSPLTPDPFRLSQARFYLDHFRCHLALRRYECSEDSSCLARGISTARNTAIRQQSVAASCRLPSRSNKLARLMTRQANRSHLNILRCGLEFPGIRSFLASFTTSNFPLTRPIENKITRHIFRSGRFQSELTLSRNDAASAQRDRSIETAKYQD